MYKLSALRFDWTIQASTNMYTQALSILVTQLSWKLLITCVMWPFLQCQARPLQTRAHIYTCSSITSFCSCRLSQQRPQCSCLQCCCYGYRNRQSSFMHCLQARSSFDCQQQWIQVLNGSQFHYKLRYNRGSIYGTKILCADSAEW